MTKVQNFILAVESMKSRPYLRGGTRMQHMSGLRKHLEPPQSLRSECKMINQMPMTPSSSASSMISREKNKRGQSWQMVETMEQDVNGAQLQEIRTQIAALQRGVGQNVRPDMDRGLFFSPTCDGSRCVSRV